MMEPRYQYTVAELIQLNRDVADELEATQPRIAATLRRLADEIEKLADIEPDNLSVNDEEGE